MNTTDHALLRLLHLSSAGLPVGAYAFSHGLEYAIEAAWLKSDADIEQWLSAQLRFSLAALDLPVMFRIDQALAASDHDAVRYWNALILASRETRELQLTDTATGLALQKLLPEFDVPIIDMQGPVSFITAFAQAARHWQIKAEMASLGLCWSWIENQVNAATKLLPMGQTGAQRMMHSLQAQVPAAIAVAAGVQDDHIGVSLPALSLASMHHETQYSRLFRS
ncbi:urease accessory protein UreF [Pseudohongiella sp.]|uniref:Urease accessory protein UreF n=1 Tax=marine sediment metagenome TaxID=412755 RepID=A0A0F9W606_9ZZZZ|nr:urease accessory UreF family protein [Pseudohongiella sp.]HDZ08213.1 urease accessory protein UreF [Pseudohongiella sp.]HEA63181.1 urease accessory protein UreF [Pseudohongiella sp.]